MRIMYVATTFPVFSETFLQREVRALQSLGVEMSIVSLHKGDARFEGLPVRLFPKASLFKLLYRLPFAFFRHGHRLQALARELVARRPVSFLNLFENLLGFGAAIVDEDWVRKQNADVIHCVWGSAPAAYGLLASALCDVPFSMGAHAYDVYEHGGDWLLAMKARSAVLVHVSTEVVEKRIRSLRPGIHVARIRRGLNELLEPKPMRANRTCLRILCVARLVEKKGFPYQLDIYEALRAADLAFEARIVGDGPLEHWLQVELRRRGFSEQVRLLGRLDEKEVQKELHWADLLFHTGVIARSGDRDGLPNVVPEAMAAGVVVVGSPVSGVGEAVSDGSTGFLCDPKEPAVWVERCRELQVEDDLFESLQRQARFWVEKEFRAERNTQRLLQELGERVEAWKSSKRT